MVWMVTIVDTLTGAPITPVPVSDFSWARALSAGSTGSCTLPIASSEFDGYDGAELEALIADNWSRTVVLDWDGDVVFAGGIVGQDWSDTTVTLQLSDIWGLWDRRGAWERDSSFVDDWAVTYTGISLPTLAKRAVELATGGSWGPVSALPMTLPADVAGSLNRTRYGYFLEFVSDVLEDLIAEGLEVDFRARWVSGALDWEMVTDPTPASHEWVKNGPDGNMARFRRVSDGKRVTNNAIFVGEGSGETLIARSRPTDPSTLPALDRLEARKNISDPVALQAVADANGGRQEASTSEWSWVTLLNGSPGIADIRMGDTASVVVSGDRWLADDTYERRIVRISGTLGEQVSVVCQPTGG